MLRAGTSPVRAPDEVNFSVYLILSSRTMAVSTRNLPGGKSGRRVGPTTLPPSTSRMSENVGASTSRNLKDLHGLYRDNFSLYLFKSYQEEQTRGRARG
jgi:hypothetical protein